MFNYPLYRKFRNYVLIPLLIFPSLLFFSQSKVDLRTFFTKQGKLQRDMPKNTNPYTGTQVHYDTKIPSSLLDPGDSIYSGGFLLRRETSCSNPCHALVNHKRKFIVVKHAKTGGTTLVRDLLEPQLCDILEKRKTNVKLTCERAMRKSPWIPLFSYNVSQRVHLWEEYLTVSLVRDPFSRAWSAFNYLDAKKYMSWDEFSSDPFKLIELVDKKSKRGVAAHLQPQCPCTLDPNSGESLVNILLSTADFDSGVKVLLEEINKRNPTLEPLKPIYRYRSRGRAKPLQFSSYNHAMICKSYAMDLPKSLGLCSWDNHR